MHKWFQKSQKLFRKKFHWKLEEMSFHCVCHVICCCKEIFQKPFTSWHDHLPFLVQSSLVKSCWSLFCHFLCSQRKTLYPSLLPYEFTHVYFSELPTFCLICTHLLPHIGVFFWLFFRLPKCEKAMSIKSPGLEKSTSKCLLFYQNYFLQIFVFALVLDDVGFLKAHLPTSLTPPTSTLYLEMRLEIIVVPWNLHALIVYLFANNHGDASLSLDW